MQLTTLLVLLASVCCASAIHCNKGGNGIKDKVDCPKEKDTCCTTTYKDKRIGTKWTCASHEECQKWDQDARAMRYDYRIYCCNNADFCNDNDNLYSEEYNELYEEKVKE